MVRLDENEGVRPVSPSWQGLEMPSFHSPSNRKARMDEFPRSRRTPFVYFVNFPLMELGGAKR